MFVYQVFVLFLLILYRLYIYLDIITSIQYHRSHRIEALLDKYNMLMGNAIIFLQECHSDPSSEEICAKNGVVRFFILLAKQYSKGVAILFSHKITFDIINIKEDRNL